LNFICLKIRINYDRTMLPGCIYGTIENLLFHEKNGLKIN
jgi:hypothetical protein